MKVIFLNTWNGRVRDAIKDFIEDSARDTDVFCFQETYDEMKQLVQSTLNDYIKIEGYKRVDDDDNFPQATYIKNSIPLLSSGMILEKDENTGLELYIQVQHKGKDLYICNFHGMSRPTEKLDNPERILQSEELIKFFKDKQGLKIIGGDFNIFPETKSIRMFQENGYRDLIKEYAIPTTRNRLVWELYPGSKQYYSDYAFVGPEIIVKKFSVPNIEISDHLPLILEIE